MIKHSDLCIYIDGIKTIGTLLFFSSLFVSSIVLELCAKLYWFLRLAFSFLLIQL